MRSAWMGSRAFPMATAAACAAIMLVKLTGCSSNEEDPAPFKPVDYVPEDAGPTGPLTIAPGPSRGSAIAISPDDSTVVAVNRDAASVSIFQTTFSEDGSPARLEKRTEVRVGEEPWQVVVAPDGKHAYVVLRKEQKLVKVALGETPSVVGSVAVGSEPTGIALTPGGSRAWVANWVDGTLTGVDTAKMEVASTIDLNEALVKTGLVGQVAARPSLAHPRSVAITNNLDGNEDDESIYVTEYYAQRVEAEKDKGENADTAKAGLVYKVKLSDKSVSTIRLGAIADMGFKDNLGGTAGCYPNQLQSITVQSVGDKSYAYVTSVCASPKGPVGAVGAPPNVDLSNIKTTTHGAVSVIDLATDKEVTSATASLHARWNGEYESRKTPDDGTRRYPAVPVDLAFTQGTGVAYVPANAADAVFRLQYDLPAGSAIAEVGAPQSNAFINLNPAGLAAEKSGQNPIGIATANKAANKRFAFVANDVTRNVTVVDFKPQAIAGDADPIVVRATELPAAGSKEDAVRKGKRFFNTATGRWSLKGQGWNGCQSCHMDGLSDNVTWFFARGPRQSTSLDGSFSKKDNADQRIFNWTAIVDEISDFEGNTRGISGGVGAIVKAKSSPPVADDRIDNAALGHAGLAGSSDAVADPENPLKLDPAPQLDDWKLITEYVKAIRPPRRPSNLDGAAIKAGKDLFVNDGSCVGCHSGAKWTISTRFYTPSAQVSATLNATGWTPPVSFPTSLLPAVDQRFMRFANGNAGAFDQIQCILRPVGTFGKGDALIGSATELRQDMSTAGQGNQTNGNGFNPPSLLGVQVGAPYLHGGGAATLESLFATGFKSHYAALAPNFLQETGKDREAKVAQLVQFLLSIDEGSDVIAIPPPGSGGGDFCKAQ